MLDTTKLAETIKSAEGFTPGIKPDSDGTWQTGYGRNLTTDPLTKEEGAFLLNGPMLARIFELSAALAWFRDLDDVRSRAFAEMAYQMGTAGFLGFRLMLKAASQGDWDTAAKNVQFNTDGSETDLAKETPTRAARYAQMLKTGLDV
jgi:lysozyme